MLRKIAVMSIAFICLAPITALVFAAGVSSAEGVYDAVVWKNEGSTASLGYGWCAVSADRDRPSLPSSNSVPLMGRLEAGLGSGPIERRSPWVHISCSSVC